MDSYHNFLGDELVAEEDTASAREVRALLQKLPNNTDRLSLPRPPFSHTAAMKHNKLLPTASEGMMRFMFATTRSS